MIPASVPADQASGLRQTLGPLRDASTMLSGLVYRSSIYRRAVLSGPVPSVVLRVFPWHAPGDRTQADALLGQEFVFFGRRVPFDTMSWSVPPPGFILARTLHGFTWLGDLKANPSDEARTVARALVMGWIGAHRGWSPVAWSPEVLGQRLASWLASSDFFLAGAGGDEQARFLEATGRQARHLVRVSDNLSGTHGAFAAVTGEIAAALCLGAVPLPPALRRLQHEIATQVLADGGQLQRSPAIHVDVFRQLLDIRSALLNAGEPVPEWLAGTIERMAPMLRTFRHGDGKLALFHGSKEGDRTLSDTLLAASKVTTPALASAPKSRFERLAAGRMLVIVDVGSPALGGHASPLAFEMSYGRERVVVNCGALGGDDARWRSALHSTAAHSTVTIEHADATDTGWLGTRRMRVASSRQETDGASWLETSHDGYRRRFGIKHHRRLYLAGTGIDIRGEDYLEGRAGRRFALRFHLHPDVQATLADDRASVALRTASGIAWRFLAVGSGRLSLDESAYLGASDQPRRCQQIVVAGTTQSDGARVRWAFRNESAA